MFQPLAFGPGEAEAVITGAVLSMLIPLTVAAAAVLPALSWQLPVLVTDWLAPLPVSVAPRTLLVAMPEPPASAQLNDTVTLVLFQPAALAAGVRLPVMVGAVESRLRVTLWVAVPPVEVAVQVNVMLAVSDDTVVGLQPVCDVTVDCASVTVHETLMSLVYQPLLPNVPVTVGLITGGVVSEDVGGITTGGESALTVMSAR